MIELLSPAGNVEKLYYAYAYGADAAYIGLKKFSLRVKADNFYEDEYKKVIELKKQFPGKPRPNSRLKKHLFLLNMKAYGRGLCGHRHEKFLRQLRMRGKGIGYFHDRFGGLRPQSNRKHDRHVRHALFENKVRRQKRGTNEGSSKD